VSVVAGAAAQDSAPPKLTRPPPARVAPAAPVVSAAPIANGWNDYGPRK
jgi:hypothetical protein